MKNAWIDNAIIYQINLRSLAAREPRNAFEAAREKPSDISPLTCVTKHLSKLRQLGVTVLHLMPPYPMGQADRKGIGSPYAAREYMTVDPEYGTLEECRAFIAEAHRKGFKVIIGMVPNHTSRDHVWMDTHPEYYVHEGDHIIYDLDWSDSAKLNYRHGGLRKAMIKIYDYWLSVLGTTADGTPDGVDGFRVDMAHFINDLSFWNECFETLQRRHGQRDLLFLAECYGIDNSMDLFQRGFNGSYDDAFYKILERFYGRTPGGQSLLLPQPGLDQDAGARKMYTSWMQGGIAKVARDLLSDYEQRLSTLTQAILWVRYTDNHDEGRGVYRFGDGAVRAFMQLAFLTAHAAPFLLTGQEFGAVNRPSIHERIGPCDKGYRTQTAQGDIRQVDGVEFEGNLFARGYSQRQAWHLFYRALIRLRKKHRILVHGQTEWLDPGEDAPEQDKSVVAFARIRKRTRLHCAVNLGPKPRRLKHAEQLDGHTVYGTFTEAILAPFSAIVVRP